ncbi:uncharacterized protein K02A2.6-like [Pararge aegeria]|uniref:uncharacterized protein K02A2.6-like n=1 Tax=Pararge aegeria TaxID=116150 RepID=UPI0019D19CA8|nr:uncharacterized protein K02A2.6-like [Pararge aegeria]
MGTRGSFLYGHARGTLNAVYTLKRELASERVLAHFDPAAPLMLTVDAGPVGLGAVLAHRDASGGERPIAFASRSLTTSEKNYSQIQKEATAIVFGVKYFHQYLYGRQEPFILKTDHRPLLSIFGKEKGISVTAALRLQRYAVTLSAYNYIVQYVDGKNNQIADFFSRAPLSVQYDDGEGDDCSKYFLFFESNAEPVLFNDIRRATAADSVLKTVMKYMDKGWPKKIKCKSILPYFQCKTDLEVVDGCLLRGHRIVIPDTYRERMLKELHSSHLGIIKTKNVARGKMWWPQIDLHIERWVNSCQTCAAVRSAPASAPPAPWPRPPGPWHRLHIDYMSIGQSVYLIVIDAYSKWLECVYMDRGTSTNALIFKLKEIFSKFGVPNVMVSDNDVKICSAEFNTFCRMNGIQYLTSPIYHPASNGQAENSVKTCKKMIKCILSESRCQRHVNEKLLSFLFNYRNTVHCTTGATPAMLMMGRNLRSRLDLILPPKENYSKQDMAALKPSRNFHVGETVWAKWFIARKAIWCVGVVKRVIGNRMFEIYFEDYKTSCNRHVDQIRKYTSFCNSDESLDQSGSTLPEQLSSPTPIPVSTHTESPVSTSAPPPPPAIVVEERDVQVATDNVVPIVGSGNDSVMGQGGADSEEKADVVTQEEPQPAEFGAESLRLVNNKSSNPSSAENSPVGRSKRSRKPIDYRQYFK